MSTTHESLVHGGVWPSLHEAHGLDAASPHASEDEWEVLSNDDPQVENEEIVLVQMDPKLLKHAASSPDFERFSKLRYSLEEDDDKDVAMSHVVESSSQEESTNTSHVLVTGPSSVVSISTVHRVSSFRDAILLQKEEMEKERIDQRQPPTRPKAPRYLKPKFVVTPIKRCAKSMVDLRSLVLVEDEVTGETDAMEFYHRKAKGYYVGRRNSLKQRPDEAKRKAIIMNKKDLQRAQQTRKG